MLMTQSTRCQC